MLVEGKRKEEETRDSNWSSNRSCIISTSQYPFLTYLLLRSQNTLYLFFWCLVAGKVHPILMASERALWYRLSSSYFRY